MPAKNIVQLLGLGQRAGQVVSGNFVVRVKIRKRETRLVIVAADAAGQTAKDFQRFARGTGIPVVVYGRKAELGAALGRPPRAVVAVLDESLAARILKLIEGGEK
ncbi:L7Ae/L30e/S12e/Gadd45 family ribosomal protein [Thermodesulfitimonas autotrophica]|uniref:L7Ae/L30e/S12e/Gadd45 family ribosomal protein n=1 Tax=Thermodesulfitimonas autotrophica TaxID=1894989 RepID=UPI002FE1027D